MSVEVIVPESVLVVGGCGFLGHHIVQQLLEGGCKKVSVLDLRTDRNRAAGVSYHSGDITSAADVAKALDAEKPMVLIHTASPVAADHVPHAVYDRVNVLGTENLLKTAGGSGHVKAFVYTSSASVVHDYVSHLRFANESYPVLKKPDTPDHYSHTKALADDMVLAANRKYGGMLTAAIRPAGIFGEGDVQLVPGVVGALRRGRTNVQVGDNTNLWDYTYVGNVAHAHLLAAQALVVTHERKGAVLDHEKVDGEAFFVTNDAPIPFWDMMRRVWTEAGWTGQDQSPWIMPAPTANFIVHLVTWLFWIFTLGTKAPPVGVSKGLLFSSQNRTYDIEKAKQRLAYTPPVSLDEGIRRGVKWHVQHNESKKEK